MFIPFDLCNVLIMSDIVLFFSKIFLSDQFVFVLWKLNFNMSASLLNSSAFKHKGLKNLKNTCYINSIVQALSYIPYFRNYLSRFTVTNEAVSNQKSTLELIQDLIAGLHNNDGDKTITPSGFVSKILSKVEQFRRGHELSNSSAFRR